MRCEPASAAKGKMTNPTQNRPRAGTRLGDFYDLLMAHKGCAVEAPLWMRTSPSGRAIEDLQSYYGLDIRHVSKGVWILAGEWFGKTYVDYIADRINAAERKP